MAKSSANPLLSKPMPKEQIALKAAIKALGPFSKSQNAAHKMAKGWVQTLRAQKQNIATVEEMLRSFPLSTDQGKALMTLAEALIRTPDSKTQNALIEDKIDQTSWTSSATSATGKTAGLGLAITNNALHSPVSHIAQPVIRKSLLTAMKKLSAQFIMGEDIDAAFIKARKFEKQDDRISYDMLGEGARTADDAAIYFRNYLQAIYAIGSRNHSGAPALHDLNKMPGISVKLSALYPRYEQTQKHLCLPAISGKLQQLMKAAAKCNITLTIDAEESWRLGLSLEIIEDALLGAKLQNWHGFGLAVQAYNKQAPAVIEWTENLAKTAGQIIQVRLVKGAYWDTEIKRAQELGLEDFPLFTRKAYTDINYLHCAVKLLQAGPSIYPLFATHNALTIAQILQAAKSLKRAAAKDFEFQRLHGMGEGLYKIIKDNQPDLRLSIYAPTGAHKELLPYLVRRILENGANSSFSNHVLSKDYDLKTLLQSPFEKAQNYNLQPHENVLTPAQLYQAEPPAGRENSAGFDPQDPRSSAALLSSIESFAHKKYKACSIIGGQEQTKAEKQPLTNPADQNHQFGTLQFARENDISASLTHAKNALTPWQKTPLEDKANILRRYADLLQQNEGELLYLLVTEAGKTIIDAQNELREAIDFCRYYAGQAALQLIPQNLPGPTGEDNILRYQGRGIFACISPWNFPLAIFTGQIAAALVASNCVIAKPAPQTSAIAHKAVKLWYKAGLPKNTLQLVLGDRDIGEALISQPGLDGVAFTGSTDAARAINQTLAMNRQRIIPLIAETGGQNAMIIDSTALPEQIIDHIITSAFGSAGQRCSALRVAYVQNEIFAPLTRLLQGAMEELSIGLPNALSSDIGPLIDENAKAKLQMHLSRLQGFGKKIAASPLNPELEKQGHFFAPHAFEIRNILDLQEENFGPILHLVRYNAKDLDDVINDINATGYGLTLGIETRIKTKVDYIASRVKAGNIYINKPTIGAIVGSQPFGGQGRSGTGPKAGGPNYLKRFCTEQTISIDTTAAGGNASLACLDD